VALIPAQAGENPAQGWEGKRRNKMTFALPKNPEEIKNWDNDSLCSFCYDYRVGIAEGEHYYHSKQPTHANLCCKIAMEELEKRGVKCSGVGTVESMNPEQSSGWVTGNHERKFPSTCGSS